MPDPTLLLVIALLACLWVFTTTLVIAACRMAAAADRSEALTSESLAPDHVADRAQQYLEVAPKRPVRHIQVVDSSHFA